MERYELIGIHTRKELIGSDTRPPLWSVFDHKEKRSVFRATTCRRQAERKYHQLMGASNSLPSYRVVFIKTYISELTST